MNDSAQQWLTNQASIPGTLASGLRAPDGRCAVQNPDESFPAEAVENIIGRFEIPNTGSTELPAPRWCSWVFEKALIRFVERPDGWRLALIVRPDSDAAHALDSASKEFLSLPSDD